VRRRHHPFVPAGVFLLLTALTVLLMTVAGRMDPFVAWVLLGVAAGYSISASV
jgi:hypothetical protein